MAQRIGGTRRKSRSKLRKHIRAKGKISLRRFFQELNGGDKVVLNLNSSFNGGIYHLRHHGKIGTVLGRNGSCYQIQIKDINKMKTLIVHPVHLKKI